MRFAIPHPPATFDEGKCHVIAAAGVVKVSRGLDICALLRRHKSAKRRDRDIMSVLSSSQYKSGTEMACGRCRKCCRNRPASTCGFWLAFTEAKTIQFIAGRTAGPALIVEWLRAPVPPLEKARASAEETPIQKSLAAPESAPLPLPSTSPLPRD